jgi:rhodanese-related sulfurtransferase
MNGVTLDELAREHVARDTAIMVHSGGPACPQSRAAGEKLAALGFAGVRVFEGGLEVWKRAGRPLAQVSAAA